MQNQELRVKHNILVSSNSIQKVPLTNQSSIYKINTEPYYPIDILQSQNSEPFLVVYDKNLNVYSIYNTLDMEKNLLTCQAFTKSSKFEAYVALKDGVYHIKAFNKKLQKNKIITQLSVFSLSFNIQSYQLAVQAPKSVTIYDLNSMLKVSEKEPKRHYCELVGSGITPDDTLTPILYNSYGNCEFQLPARIRIQQYTVNFDQQRERQLFGIENDLIYYFENGKIYFFDGKTGLCVGVKINVEPHAIRVVGSRIYVMAEKELHVYEMPIFVNFQELKFSEFIEYQTGIICLNEGVSYILDFAQNKTYCFENTDVNEVILQSQFMYLEKDILYILQPGAAIDSQSLIKTQFSPLYQEKQSSFKLKIDKDLCFALEVDETMDNVLQQLEDVQVELDAGVNIIQQQFGIGVRDYSVDEVLTIAAMNLRVCDNFITSDFYLQLEKLERLNHLACKEDSLQLSQTDAHQIQASPQQSFSTQQISHQSKAIFDYSINSQISQRIQQNQSMTASQYCSRYEESNTSRRLLNNQQIAQSNIMLPTFASENQTEQLNKISIIDDNKFATMSEKSQFGSINENSVISLHQQSAVSNNPVQPPKRIQRNPHLNSTTVLLNESILDSNLANFVVELNKTINDQDQLCFTEIIAKIDPYSRLQIAEIYENYYQISISSDIMANFTGKFSEISSMLFIEKYEAWGRFLAGCQKQLFIYLVLMIQPNEKQMVKEAYFKVTGRGLADDIKNGDLLCKEFLLSWIADGEIDLVQGVERILLDRNIQHYLETIKEQNIQVESLPDYLQIAHSMKCNRSQYLRGIVQQPVPQLLEALTVLSNDLSGSAIQFKQTDLQLLDLLQALWNRK